MVSMKERLEVVLEFYLEASLAVENLVRVEVVALQYQAVQKLFLAYFGSFVAAVCIKSQHVAD